jgi:DNA-binding response OmpR family regulator
VAVDVRLTGSEAVFAVRDEGRGIPADQLEAIFERFRQVDASDRREKGGTGLGLAIAREIVLQHRGRIWAESEPGRGSVFSFTLPVPGRALTIAVCDRRSRTREELAARLRALGQRAVGFESPEAVVAAAQREGVAAIVLPLGPASGATIAALDAAPETAGLPKLVLKGPRDETGLLAVLEAAVPELRPGRVLVVEDDPDLGRLLTASLARNGRDVQLARTGREAREAIERAAPALVVLDLGLPGEDGFAVVDWLRRQGALAGVPLLVYTARSLGEDDRERLQLGATEFLDKTDVPPDALDRRVTELLEHVVADQEAG